ncbi:DsbE family thiol:disulfide interchange protein [Sphingosinicella sp. BN140058]|uniref:DsbE family thiol:disulfide interchange protein n=1 Tax=Sphingosinicella sp. BN140058 TaxID=1892855 RepID=UPI001011C2D1|nr:DsbE family thiol:disulfide interchange protein [Sphingosinicella sp. BN140058]QAY79130.1 DsbE family thiol:disulfide interchange protein [Sphingosinicella sp. BN140058]
MRRILLFLPLGAFVLIVAVFAFRLHAPGDSIVRSRMIGKPMPAFVLKAMVGSHPGLTAADLRAGRPRLVNVFGSWCIPCRAEAPQLETLKARGLPIDAIAIRDTPGDVAAFLKDYGDPFQRIGDDPRSQVQFALGSSGVPETFVVDGRGIIRHQHIGDIRPEHVDEIVKAYEAAR